MPLRFRLPFLRTAPLPCWSPHPETALAGVTSKEARGSTSTALLQQAVHSFCHFLPQQTGLGSAWNERWGSSPFPDVCFAKLKNSHPPVLGLLLLGSSRPGGHPPFLLCLTRVGTRSFSSSSSDRLHGWVFIWLEKSCYGYYSTDSPWHQIHAQ